MNSTIRTVTPEDAQKILRGNTINRTIRASWVSTLARAIKAGDWNTTHQGIAIATDGTLLDGQHRLMAIIEANKAVKMMVTTGMDRDVFRHIDGGKSRATKDRIKLCEDQAINARCCSLVNAFLRSAKGRMTPTIDDVENVFLEMSDSFLYVASAYGSPVKLVTLMPVGAALVGFHHKHADSAVTATEHLLTGRMMDEGNPMLTLREALLGQRLRGESELYWKSVAALKAHLEGRTLRSVYAATEDFNGNVYSRLAWHRQDVRKAGAETRRKRLAEA